MRHPQWQLAAVLSLSLLSAAPLFAQQMPVQQVPDVQVVVAPGYNGWSIATVYPRLVPRLEVQQRLKRMASVTGWKIDKPEFNDSRLDRSSLRSENKELQKEAKAVGAAQIMSSATFQLQVPLVDYQEGTLTIEPFVRTFRDLNRVHVTFLVPGKFTYRGLRRYADKNIELGLSEQEGAFTYVVNIKSHQFENLNLPRFELVRPDAVKISDAKPTGAGRQRWLVGTGLVALIAAGAAGLAYIFAHRLIGR